MLRQRIQGEKREVTKTEQNSIPHLIFLFSFLYGNLFDG